jgi:lysyl-tRNA synthetase class I
MKPTMNLGGINMTSKFILNCSQIRIIFSDVRISDRLDEIDKWRKNLEYTIQDVENEIQAIQSAKEQCERYLEHMRSPLGKYLIQN